ncbi:MAG TPA: XdhC/CoxI family protein [Afifellaceae bacterium]|nr:XdhC/CoxI family protein [Afifellaceae bacterium]
MSRANILDVIADLRARGAEFCVVTVVRTANATSAKAGAKAVITAEGALHGFVGGGCVTGAARRAAAEALAAGAARLIRVRPRDEVAANVDADGVELHRSSCPSGGTVELFIEPVSPPPRLAVCGASPIAASLVRLGSALGYRTITAALPEDHAEIAGADRVLAGFDLADVNLRPSDAVIVATQGRRDSEALKAALASPAGYVGMVGSRRKIAALKAQLAEQGVAPQTAARLHGPAGLAIGAIGPDEIALSILAEIIQTRRQTVRAGAGSGEIEGGGRIGRIPG